MRFQIPQFIEHETKVIGPLTFKQAAYLGAPIPVIILLWFSLPLNLFVVTTIALELLGAAFAFVKVGPKSFPEFVISIFRFSASPRTYIWKRGQASLHFSKANYEAKKAGGNSRTKLTTESRVGNLATKVQTKR